MRILLADDHALVRAGLRALMDGFAGCEVVAEAADGQQALDLAAQLQPDVVVLDVTMPGMDGLEAARRLRECAPAVKVVMLSMHTGEHYLREALKCGARAYVVKDAAPEELEQALACVRDGGVFLSPSVAASGDGAGLELLTGRQREILRLIASGLSTREIAVHLEISVKTVETHRAQLMQRLDIHDVAGLTRFALRSGLVADD